MYESKPVAYASFLPVYKTVLFNDVQTFVSDLQ